MFPRSSLVAGAMALGLMFAPSLSAQAVNCGLGQVCGHTLNAVVPTLVNLTVESPSTSLGSITTAQFDGGQLVTGPSFETRANTAHRVWLRAATATFTGQPKLASDVSFAAVTDAAGCGAASYAALSSTAVSIFGNGAGRSDLQRLCFSITWDYETDAPGNYDLPLELTVTAP